MRTWFTADTHFGHKRVIELCDRPFSSVDDMNNEIIERINEVVSEKDRLIILGDICMGQLIDSLPLLGRLRAGELVLVPGNHDRWSLAYDHRGDQDAKRDVFRSRYVAESGHSSVVAFKDCDPSAWRGLFSLTGEWRHTGGPLSEAWFSHYPFDGDSHGDGEDRYGWLRAEDDGAAVVHGHVHGEWAERGRQMNVGVDVRDFQPVSEEEVEAWLKSL